MDEEGNQTPQDPPPPAAGGTPPPASGPAASSPGPAYAGSLPPAMPAPPSSDWSTTSPSYKGPSVAAGTKRNAAYLVIAGGIVVLVSMLLPWETATLLGRSITGNAFKVGWWPTLGLAGAFAIIRGYGLMNQSTKLKAGTPWISVIWITISLVLMYVSIHSDIDKATNLANSAGFGSSLSTSIGIGFWVAIVGLVLVAAGAVMSSNN